MRTDTTPSNMPPGPRGLKQVPLALHRDVRQVPHWNRVLSQISDFTPGRVTSRSDQVASGWREQCWGAGMDTQACPKDSMAQVIWGTGSLISLPPLGQPQPPNRMRNQQCADIFGRWSGQMCSEVSWLPARGRELLSPALAGS